MTPRSRNSASWFGWSLAAFGLVTLFPDSITRMDFRASFGRGASVSPHRSSPAYAAFEDAHESLIVPERPIPDNGKALEAGRPLKISVPVAQRRLALKGMTIKAPVESDPFMVAHHQRQLKLPEPATDFSRMSMEERKLALLETVAPEELAVPSVAMRARQLIENQRTIQTASGTRVLLAETKPVGESIDTSAPRSEAGGLIPLSESSRPQNSQVELRGHIEMTGGLAFAGPETLLDVRQVVAGVPEQSGQVWVTQGRFAIRVKDLRGTLVASLRRRNGEILGRGELNLLGLREVRGRNDRIDDIRLALMPVSEGLSPVAAYPAGSYDAPVNHAAVQSLTPTTTAVDRSSSFLARAEAEKHWPSLTVGHSQKSQNVRMLSEGLVSALIDTQVDRSEQVHARDQAVVWGRVQRDGRAPAGVRVELAEKTTPIYFNEAFIADKKLDATSPNGLFAFVKVSPGVQALRLKADGQVYPAQVFPTEAKHVSYVDFKLRDHLLSQFRVVDGMNPETYLAAHLQLVGTDAALKVNGEGVAEYSAASEQVMLEADAGPDFELTRLVFAAGTDTVTVPMVRRSWLAELRSRATPTAPRGTVLGFVDHVDFHVEMSGYAPQEQAQIVYFDAEGQIAEKGVAGGGFVILNPPAGLQTVYIYGGQVGFSQVVVPEAQFVHVVNWTPDL